MEQSSPFRSRVPGLLAAWSLVAALALASTASADGASIAVFPVQGTNLDEADARAIGALLAGSLIEASGGPVLPPSQSNEALEASRAPAAASQALGVEQYVVVTAVRLDTRIRIAATLHNRHGSPLFSEHMTAASLDDVEQVVERLARALVRRTPSEHTMTLDNVTGREATRPNRTAVERVVGVRAGVVFIADGGGLLDPAVVSQIDIRRESRSYFVELAGGFLFPSDRGSSGRNGGYGGLIGDVGASWYLTDGLVAPYLGAGLSPRITGGGRHRGGVGLATWGQVGLMFMRQSSARFYSELRLGQNVVPLRPATSDPYSAGLQVDGGGKASYPTELTLAVGVGW